MPHDLSDAAKRERMTAWIVAARDSSRWIGDLDQLASVLATTGRIQTINLHHLALLRDDPCFFKATMAADFWTADGWPIVRFARKLGVPVRRVTGRDVVNLLVGRSSPPHVNVRRVALIGGTSGAGAAFSRRLEDAGRRLVVGEHGDAAGWTVEALRTMVKDTQAEVVLTAVTPPTGETIAAGLAADGQVVCGTGGAVAMLVGEQAGAPALAARLRGEWLWRLARNPRRLGRRYLLEGVPTFFRYDPAVRRAVP